MKTEEFVEVTPAEFAALTGLTRWESRILLPILRKLKVASVVGHRLSGPGSRGPCKVWRVPRVMIISVKAPEGTHP